LRFWLRRQFLKNEESRMYAFHGVFPADLAKDSGMTRLAVELALRSCAVHFQRKRIAAKTALFLTEKGRNA